MIILRSLLFSIAFYGTTIAFLLFASPVLLIRRQQAVRVLTAHARVSVWLMKVIVGARLEVRGADNLPGTPCLIAAKHQSAWDTFALIPLFRDPAMVMKAELGLIPLYGWYCRKFEHILVQRKRGGSALKQMNKDALARAADGRDILIFPEGTRRVPNAAPDYKSGVLSLYEGLNCPCVPVALNSGLFWPRRSFLRYPGTIIVEILPPILPGLARKEFRNLLITRIEAGSAALLEEAKDTKVPPPLPMLQGQEN